MTKNKSIVSVSIVALSVLLFLGSWFLMKNARSDEAQQVIGADTLTVEDDAIKWLLTNTGSNSAVIENIEITWPEQYGNLRQVVFNGSIYKGSMEAPSATLDVSLLGKEKHRTLKKGKSWELHFKFDQIFSGAIDAQFRMAVNFEDGTTLTFGQVLNPLVGELEVEAVAAIDSPLDSLPGISTPIGDGSVLYLLSESGVDGLGISGDTGGVDLPSFVGNTYFTFKDPNGYGELYVVLETDEQIMNILGCNDSTETCSIAPTSQIADNRILFIAYPNVDYAISTKALIKTKQ